MNATLIMEKYVKYICGLVLAFCIVQEMRAQRPSVVMERLLTEEALTTVDNYISQIALGDEEVYYSFLELFAKDDAPVYNDLFGLSSAESLPLKEYANLLNTETKNTQIHIANIRKDKIWRENDRWKVQISFEKNVAYSNKCGVYLSSQDFYEKNYLIKMTLAYDEESRTCKIERVDGTIDSNKSLPDGYYVFISKSKKDANLSYQGKPLTFNSYGQTFINSPLKNTDFEYKDPDTKLVITKDDVCRLLSASYTEKRMRLKLHYDLNMGSALSVGNVGKEILKGCSQNKLGVDIGYIFPAQSKFKTGIFGGLGIENTQMDLAYQSTKYTYETNEDVDKDTYDRQYSDLNISQSIKYSTLNIPVYFDFSLNFNKYVGLYVDLGTKMNFAISNSVGATQGSATVTGVYPHYQNLVIGGDWGYNGFGYHDYSDSDLDSKNFDNLMKFTLDALLGGGLRLGMPNMPISIELGVDYQMGLNNLLDENYKKVKLSNPASTSAIVYNMINGTSSKEHVKNLTEALDEVRTSSLKFHVGVVYRF